MNIFDVNWLGVVLAALAGFVVGGIWYGPVMGKKWMGAVGLTEDDIKSGNMGAIYGGAFAFSLLASWTLAHTFATYGVDLSVPVKVLTAFGVALGFVVPAIGTNYLFSQNRRRCFLSMRATGCCSTRRWASSTPTCLARPNPAQACRILAGSGRRCPRGNPWCLTGVRERVA